MADDLMIEYGIWIAIALAAAATYLWRGLGVMIAGHIRVDGPVFAWVSYVAYGLLAALVARMILMPVSPSLQGIPLAVRIGCAVAGYGVYRLARRNTTLGVAVGATLLGAYAWWLG